MKKFLSMLLVVVLCLTGLIACGNNDEDLAALEDAATYLNTMYKDKTTNTPNDYDVVAKVVVGGKTYTVTWATSNENVVVKESSKTGFWTIDVPAMVTEEIAYTLTATIADANGNTATKSFNRVVPVVDKGGITSTPEEGVAYKLYLNQVTLKQRLYALTTTQQDNKFIETTNDAKQAADFYVENVDGGVKIYTTIDGVKTYVYAKTTTGADNKVSKYVGFSTENSTVFEYVQATNSWQTTIDGTKYVFGTYSTYKTACISEATYINAENTGVEQFVVEFMTKAHAETLEPDGEVKVEVPTPNTTLTIPEANELGLKVIGYTEGKYYVTGTISEIVKSDYGNLYITDAEGNKLYVYGTYSADGSTRYDAMDPQPKVGDTITVYGVIGNYSNAPQMKNAWVTALNGEDLTPDTPDTPTTNMGVVTEVAVDTAYKFGMVQSNVSTTAVYYLAGGMSNYYMATTDNAANAIDVYLETAEGGYYLYTMVDGAKTYINMVVSSDGAHVNGAYEATASTIYTFDAEKGTIVATVNEELYWFGTRNDKNYTTVGPCAVSYNGFYCQFYAATEGGEDVGGGDEGGSQTPDVITTIPEALAAGDGASVVLTGWVKSIDQAWDSYWNNISVTLRDADGNTIYVYRMGTNVNLGDYITVTGTMGSYNGAPQVAQGSTAQIITAHTECTEFTDATCTAASLCVVCGVVNSPALGHSYTDGACTVCGEAEPTTPVVKYVLKATASDGTAYYWTGAVNSGKGVITTDAAEAAQFIMEEAEGGVYIYFVDNAGVKQYITIGTTNTGLGVSTTATVISYDAATGYIYSGERYLATYGVQDIRTYKASNIPGSSNNMYLVMTVVE